MGTDTPRLSLGHTLSGREAAERLGVLGVDRESARRAPLAGVPGPAVRTRAALLYDEARVDDLAGCSLVPMGELPLDQIPAACRAGTFVARLSPRRPDPGPDRAWRGVDLTAPRAEQLDAARMWFRMSVWTRTLVRMGAEIRGFVPFVATVSGFVVLGADVSGVDIDGTHGVALRLTDPGAWFETWRGRRFNTGAGGPWQWWNPEESTPGPRIAG